MNLLSVFPDSSRQFISSFFETKLSLSFPVRLIYFVGLISFLILTLVSCGSVVGTTIGVVNKIDQNQNRSRTNDLVSEHLKMIKELQARGDSLGDYLWAEANENENNWIDSSVKDPKIIKKMYIDAANKGSIDAQIVLGIKRFYAGSITHRWDDAEANSLARNDLMQDGLKRIEQATQTQCWYYKPYIFPQQNKRCLTPVIAAREPYFAYRDGYVYLKDEVLRDYWKQKYDTCKASPDYQDALRKCHPFGD